MKVEAVKAFHSSNKCLVAKIEFTIESYLEGMTDYRAKVQSIFLNLELSQLNAKDETIDIEEGACLGDAKVASAMAAEAIPQPPSFIVLVESNALVEEPAAPTDTQN
ncbi:hypothetical protein COCNU_02G017540 [Cocos nucifera]|uniref:Uncharacterized protein n=1 Tax=Cocos nucifera TaxID=13894 RepID=A0A8K0I0M3_COCNU|nr:hypothetical protein COCNU_02G017540 [Cocos nucifera]